MSSIIDRFDRAYARHGDDPDRIVSELNDPFYYLYPPINLNYQFSSLLTSDDELLRELGVL